MKEEDINFEKDSQFFSQYTKYSLANTLIFSFSMMALSLAASYITLSKILKLKEKGFQLLIVGYLQLSFLCNILFAIMQDKFYKSYQYFHERPQLVVSQYAWSYTFLFSGLMANNIAHCLFATKYWVIQKKITALFKGQDDSQLQQKTQFIFFIQLFLIIIPGIAIISTEWRFFFIGQNDDTLQFTGYPMFLGPIASIIIQISALVQLKKLGGARFTLNSYQVVFQSISLVLVIAADTAMMSAYFNMKSPQLTFALTMTSIFFNCIGYSTFLITLYKIASLQLQDQNKNIIDEPTELQQTENQENLLAYSVKSDYYIGQEPIATLQNDSYTQSEVSTEQKQLQIEKQQFNETKDKVEQLEIIQPLSPQLSESPRSSLLLQSRKAGYLDQYDYNALRSLIDSSERSQDLTRKSPTRSTDQI